MKRRTHTIIRTGLTGLAAGMLLLMAASCFCGLFVHRERPLWVSTDVSITRAALHVVHSDRRAVAASYSNIPKEGWRWSLEPRTGGPLLEWTPQWGNSGTTRFSGWMVRLPLWIPLAAVLAPCACMWFHWRRRTKQPPHLCTRCGYDLRGSRGNACPECGEATLGG